MKKIIIVILILFSVSASYGQTKKERIAILDSIQTLLTEMPNSSAEKWDARYSLEYDKKGEFITITETRFDKGTNNKQYSYTESLFYLDVLDPGFVYLVEDESGNNVMLKIFTVNNKEVIAHKSFTALGSPKRIYIDHLSIGYWDKSEIEKCSKLKELFKKVILDAHGGVAPESTTIVKSDVAQMNKKPLEIDYTKDPVYFIVETMPIFGNAKSTKDGEIDMRKYIDSRVRELDFNMEGKVYISFIVNKEGKVANVKVARGVSDLLDNMAVKIIEGLPDFIPGEQRGNKANVSFTVPINFKN